MNSAPRLTESAELGAVHAQLRALYAREYPEGAPYLYEVLLRRLPDYIRALVRRKLDLLILEEIGDPEKTHANLNKDEQAALSMFLDMQVLRAHLEVGRDAALSNDDHSIAHIDTQPPIIARNLIAVASSEEPPLRLERMGAIFVDVDGTKTIVDCTSHSHAGRYLESMAESFCRPSPRLKSYLDARAFKLEAYAVAGDEFLLIVRSETKPIAKEELDALSREVQSCIAADPRLTHHISFDDPHFVIEYDDDWTDDDRAEYKREPGRFVDKLRSSREKLPDRFTPSISCGSATFLEALTEALSPDTEEANTLEELGINAFRLMVAKADERLKADKRIFREHIEDPKWKAFLLRNGENRRLQLEMDDLRAKLETAMRRVRELEGTGLVG